ncbi:MAG: hypothetical protein PVG99_11135 [Desulfobacteraceae bacterium]|jgi:hypothetical protein
MTAVEHFSSLGLSREKEICSTCRHSTDCRLNHRKGGKPVLLCEEFELDSEFSKDGTRERDFVRPIPQDTPMIDKNNLAQSYIGLCRTCKKLPLCCFTKPGGGTWECSDYEPKTTA